MNQRAKDDSPKSLHTVWFQVYNIVEKIKQWDSKISGYQEVGMEEKWIGGAQGFLGQ